MNISTQQLEALSKEIEEKKSNLGKAQGKLENLTNQKEQVEAEIRKEGIEPEALPAHIQEINTQMENLYSQITELLK